MKREVLQTVIVSCLLTAGCGPVEQELGEATEHYLAAQDALAAGDSTTALKELEASIQAQPDVWAYFQRARLLSEMGQDQRALADCRAGLALDPEHEQLKWLEAELRKPAPQRFRGSERASPVTK